MIAIAKPIKTSLTLLTCMFAMSAHADIVKVTERNGETQFLSSQGKDILESMRNTKPRISKAVRCPQGLDQRRSCQYQAWKFGGISVESYGEQFTPAELQHIRKKELRTISHGLYVISKENEGTQYILCLSYEDGDVFKDMAGLEAWFSQPKF